MYLFKITAVDWERIKLSIDSKCRSALRRKRKALEVQRPPGQPASNYLVVCSANNHLPTANCTGLASAAATDEAAVTGAELASSESLPCLDGGPKDVKRNCSEAAHRTEETIQRGQDQALLQQHQPNKTEQTTALGSQSQDSGGHVAPAGMSEYPCNSAHIDFLSNNLNNSLLR